MRNMRLLWNIVDDSTVLFSIVLACGEMLLFCRVPAWAQKKNTKKWKFTKKLVQNAEFFNHLEISLLWCIEVLTQWWKLACWGKSWLEESMLTRGTQEAILGQGLAWTAPTGLPSFVDDGGAISMADIRGRAEIDRNYTAMCTHVWRSVHLSALLITWVTWGDG
jgi:hypothetical protein